MTSRLTKTIKVTDATHKAIRVAAANEGTTMAEWLAHVVSTRTHPIMSADYATLDELIKRLSKEE